MFVMEDEDGSVVSAEMRDACREHLSIMFVDTVCENMLAFGFFVFPVGSGRVVPVMFVIPNLFVQLPSAGSTFSV